MTSRRSDEVQVWNFINDFRQSLYWNNDTDQTLPQYFKSQGYLTLGAGKLFHYNTVCLMSQSVLIYHDNLMLVCRSLPTMMSLGLGAQTSRIGSHTSVVTGMKLYALLPGNLTGGLPIFLVNAVLSIA
jgi:hypothetical protein